jgi:hypothetical protein
MKAEHKRILTECLQRMAEHAAAPRPGAWQTWSRETFDAETVHGPRYSSGEWFGPLKEHERMRYRRALADLERDGYLTTWCRWGRRLSHVKLTAEGERVARALLAAAGQPEVPNDG